MHKNYTQLLATLLQKIAKGSVPGYHTCKGTLDKVIISSSEPMSRLSLLRPLRLRYLIIRSVVDGLVYHFRRINFPTYKLTPRSNECQDFSAKKVGRSIT